MSKVPDVMSRVKSFIFSACRRSSKNRDSVKVRGDPYHLARNFSPFRVGRRPTSRSVWRYPMVCQGSPRAHGQTKTQSRQLCHSLRATVFQHAHLPHFFWRKNFGLEKLQRLSGPRKQCPPPKNAWLRAVPFSTDTLVSAARTCFFFSDCKLFRFDLLDHNI